MNLLRPFLLFWVCILALLGAATAGAQTQPLEASFDVTPAAPTANAPVTFTDTTQNPTGAQLEYARDLDADDSFDDGVTPTVTKTFPKGRHRVALRVRRIGTMTQTDSVARTITVGEALPPTQTATPTPSPTATATAPVINAPRINLPPQARLAHQRGPEGPGQICLGPLVRLGKPKTFDASESSDAEGKIRYEWDVDDRAPGPVKPGQVRGLRTQRVKQGLRVTWKPGGARHVVTASLSDGRRFVRNVDGRSVVIRGVARRTRATVAVRAVSESGVLGKQVRVR